MPKKFKVVVILGPTSSGKSDIAIKIAKDFNGEVISADSRQVFRDMNLGTGKIEGSWKKKYNKKVFVSEKVVHHLLDFRSPRGEYNVSQFKKSCEKLLTEICRRGKLPIICGGTGFWISAVVDNVQFPPVKPNKKLRNQLSKKSNEQLLDILKQKDPTRSKSIDKNNKIRLIRAIEISEKLGKVPKMRRETNHKYQFMQVGIDWPQDILDRKIKKRLETRWTAGMIKEVIFLKNNYGLSWKKIQSFGLGYFWIPEYLQGNVDKQEMKERVFRAERGYAKKQRTWFKRDKTIIWESKYQNIKRLTKSFLK